MTLYRSIITKSWKIAWRNKFLWFFGLFAALLGVGGELDILVNGVSGEINYGILAGFKNFIQSGLLSNISLANMLAASKASPFSMLLILIIGIFSLAISIFLVWIMNVSQIALVVEAANISKDKPTKNFKIQKGVEVGVKNFWPVFSFNLGLKILVFLIFSIFFWFISLTLIKGSGILATLIYSLIFVIFIPLAIAFSFIVKYAIAYVVIKGEKFNDALKHGWVLFSKNWLISLEVAFVLYFIFFVATVIFIIVQFNLMIAFTFITLILGKLSPTLAFWIYIPIKYSIISIFAVFIAALTVTFQTSAWTLLFLELTTKGATSKLNRIFDKK